MSKEEPRHLGAIRIKTKAGQFGIHMFDEGNNIISFDTPGTGVGLMIHLSTEELGKLRDAITNALITREEQLK